jgi:DNA-binding NarL/FixJ family response regulator
MARTLVFSEHTLLRQGLSRLLNDAAPGHSTTEAANLSEALASARGLVSQAPEVILLHVSNPDISQLDTLRVLREAVPSIPVVLLVEEVRDEVIVAALQAGAAGCLDIAVDASSLALALAEAVGGEIALSQSFARRVARMIGASGNGHERRLPMESLTSREAEILGLLADGLTNREIASTLFVSESTVRAHLRTITQKLGVNNRVHAVARALQLGMVAPPRQKIISHSVAPAMVALLSFAGLAQGLPL